MTPQELKKFQRALKEAAQVFPDVDITIESPADILREAASVLAYFDLREQFREETCRNCGQKFAYAHYTTAVKHCSIPCIDASLRRMGLKWNPTAPLERRWGRHVPAVVPAEAYKIVQEQAPLPIKQKEEPAHNDLAADLAKLGLA